MFRNLDSLMSNCAIDTLSVQTMKEPNHIDLEHVQTKRVGGRFNSPNLNPSTTDKAHYYYPPIINRIARYSLGERGPSNLNLLEFSARMATRGTYRLVNQAASKIPSPFRQHRRAFATNPGPPTKRSVVGSFLFRRHEDDGSPRVALFKRSAKVNTYQYHSPFPSPFASCLFYLILFFTC